MYYKNPAEPTGSNLFLIALNPVKLPANGSERVRASDACFVNIIHGLQPHSAQWQRQR